MTKKSMHARTALTSPARLTEKRRALLIVQKYGGTSVGTVERIRERRAALPRHPAPGPPGGRDRLGDVGRDQPPARPGQADLPTDARRARAGRHRLDRRAGDASGCWRSPSRPRAASAVSLLGHQVRILTDSAFARARIKDIDARADHAALDERQDRRRRRVPGRRRGGQHHDARPRRLRHLGGRDRGGAQGRRLRDLHRRRRRLHRRPERRPHAPARSTASATRRCWSWRRWAPRCCRSARSSSR